MINTGGRGEMRGSLLMRLFTVPKMTTFLEINQLDFSHLSFIEL